MECKYQRKRFSPSSMLERTASRGDQDRVATLFELRNTREGSEVVQAAPVRAFIHIATHRKQQILDRLLMED